MNGPTLREERIGWLRALVSQFLIHYQQADDEDPAATCEMLTEVQALADELEREEGRSRRTVVHGPPPAVIDWREVPQLPTPDTSDIPL